MEDDGTIDTLCTTTGQAADFLECGGKPSYSKKVRPIQPAAKSFSPARLSFDEGCRGKALRISVMRYGRTCVGWLGLVAGAVWATGAAAQTPVLAGPLTKTEQVAKPAAPSQAQTSARRVPLDQVPPALRERVRLVLEQPTLFARGPVESFRGRQAIYEWLLDHPDAASRAWRKLGAPCTAITERGAGVFGSNDGQGSDVRWQTAYRNERLVVWYADGKVRPVPLLPVVPVQAVVVLRFAEGKDALDRPMMRHQADVFFQTDSKTAAAVTGMFGPSAPKFAEQCVGQMEMFFSALTWYFGQHPERVESLLKGL